MREGGLAGEYLGYNMFSIELVAVNATQCVDGGLR